MSDTRMASRFTFTRSISTDNEFDRDPIDEDLNPKTEGAVALKHRSTWASRNNLFTLGLLEFLCKQLEPDKSRHAKLFKVLFDQLIKMKVVHPMTGVEELIKDHYTTSFNSILCDALAKEGPTFSPAVDIRIDRALTVRLEEYFQSSRYHTDYCEICELGRGAYGSVFKVRHKVDDITYAIKEVYFQHDVPHLWNTILREVKQLASLSHKNIIRYHSAWLEFPRSLLHHPAAIPGCSRKALLYSERSSIRIESLPHNNEEYSGSSVVFENTEERLQSNRSVHWDVDTSSSSHSSHDDLSEPIVLVEGYDLQKKSYAVLYIQMELCKGTLRDWLVSRNSNMKAALCEDDTRSILQQILKGVNHIHCNNVIHRDLKPVNIFLLEDKNGKPRVKIGDFGLARDIKATSTLPTTPLTPCPGLVCGDGLENDAFTSGVGTTIYAAPEQLEGSCYDIKADIFSIGLIMYELYHPFGTEMERIHHLHRLRKGEMPDTFDEKGQIQSSYIKSCIDHDPSERPSAQELLNSEIFHSKDQIISDLKRQLRQHEEEIRYLREALEQERQKNRVSQTNADSR